MRGKKHLFLCLVLSLLLGTAACSKEELAFEECNDIFTESFYEEIQEIVLWSGNVKYIVADKKTLIGKSYIFISANQISVLFKH